MRIPVQDTMGIIFMVVGITQVSQIFIRAIATPITKKAHLFKALALLERQRVPVRLVQDLEVAQKVTVVN